MLSIVVSGAIGSLSSTTAIPGAALAGQLPVSLISPGATDPALSDKFKYPTFLRTVPSYAVFAQVGWLLDITSYINTICLPPLKKPPKNFSSDARMVSRQVLLNVVKGIWECLWTSFMCQDDDLLTNIHLI